MTFRGIRLLKNINLLVKKKHLVTYYPFYSWGSFFENWKWIIIYINWKKEAKKKTNQQFLTGRNGIFLIEMTKYIEIKDQVDYKQNWAYMVGAGH